MQMVYNVSMIKLEISANEGNQRLDRFLKKYYRNAPLSYIYKLLRTGVKVNGKRVAQNTRLAAGDLLTIDISEEEEKAYLAREKPGTIKRQFQIAYEDENLLVVEKPFGLLTLVLWRREEKPLPIRSLAIHGFRRIQAGAGENLCSITCQPA